MADTNIPTQLFDLSWERRAKSVYPMPGGVTNYLESFRWTARQIQGAQVSPSELATRMVHQYAVSSEYAKLSIGFLRKAGLLDVQSDVCNLPDVTRLWLRDDDPAPLILTLHHGVQFIGEMLAVLDVSMTSSDLLRYANERYQMGWKSTGQVGSRAAWLRSAGLMGLSDKRLLYRTSAGTAFLDLVVVEPALGHRPVGPTASNDDVGSFGGAKHRLAEHWPSRAAHQPWEDRASGVQPMTGGYDRFFDSLRWVAESVRDIPPHRDEIISRVASGLRISEKSAESKVGFLQKVEFLRVDAEVWTLADLLRSWLLDDDPTPLVVQLHRRIKFIGEMLEALSKPMRIEGLRQLACEQYLMNWQTNTQIDNRRGWLQSAGLVGFDTDTRVLYRTDAGSAFLEFVAVESPLEADRRNRKDHDVVAEATGLTSAIPDRRALGPEPSEAQLPSRDKFADELAGRIISASTDSDNPTRFEKLVRDAFQFLGFNAKHLGGSGETDVLLEARFGARAGYRVVVDAKTTSHAALPTQQVVFDTLAEHRDKHKAEFAMVVGPNPSARKLVERASRHAVPVMSAETLAELCIMHAAQPLGLAAYRSMFERGGAADTSIIRTRAEEGQSLTSLAKRLVNALAEEAQTLGPMTAAGLRISMHHRKSEDLPTEEEIGAVLSSLASPLVGAIQGEPSTGYVLACSPAVTAERLRILGKALAAD